MSQLTAAEKKASEEAAIKARGEAMGGAVSGLLGGFGGLFGGGQEDDVAPVITGKPAPVPYPRAAWLL